MQQELVELRQVRDAAHEVAEIVEIPEGNEDEPLTLAGRLRKVPVLVKSYWPQTPLDALGKSAKSDCTDEQFNQYLQETSMVSDQIVEALNKPESP